MNRKKRSPIWKIDRQQLLEIVKNYDSISKILKWFGLNNIGGNYKTLQARLLHENIDYSHIKKGSNANLGRKFPFAPKIKLEDILVQNSSFPRGHLKNRLIKSNIIKNECSKCHLTPLWEGEPLVMIMDHINGIRDDNRLENLRLLCPNCNSQTDTFAGKNRKKVIINCSKCFSVITKQSKSGLCRKCVTFSQRKTKNRPSKEVLIQQIIDFGYCGTGRKYNVSGTAVKKWIGNTKIQKPVKPIKYCRECSIILGPKNKIGLCIKCFNSLRYNTKNKPAKEILIKAVDEYGLGKTGIKYNVSSTTIRRWLGRINNQV